jgi:hypothetical protein
VSDDNEITDGKKKAAGLNAVALAVASLLASSSAPAQSSLQAIVEQAKLTTTQATPKTTPPLVIQPSSSPIQLDHSSHASHASHSSHYSSSTDGGGDGDTPSGGDNSGSGSSQDNPPPASPPSPPASTQPVGAPEWIPDTSYPYTVDLDDGREIRCDIKDDGDYYDLVKRAGTIRVLKTDVTAIHRNVPTTKPTTEPSTDPSASQPSP